MGNEPSSRMCGVPPHRMHSIVNQEILVSVGKPVLVYGVEPVGGVVWMPDPDDKIPRFRMNFTVTYRNTQIDLL